MYNLAEEQQVLLEMRDTGTRLRNEAEALKMTIKFLAARNALKNAVG